MVKLVGSLCILTGGGLTWYIQMAERRRQRQSLEYLLSALRRMSEEIRMARTPLPQLFHQLAEDCDGDICAFFKSAANCAKEGGNLSEIWESESKRLPLPKELQSKITEIGKNLHGDEESICKVLSFVIYALAKYSGKIQEERAMEEQKTTALCFSAAALLVILLI